MIPAASKDLFSLLAATRFWSPPCHDKMEARGEEDEEMRAGSPTQAKVMKSVVFRKTVKMKLADVPAEKTKDPESQEENNRIRREV